ncbi:DUF4393 domain-containing protein [Limosilactobacillus mucosae]
MDPNQIEAWKNFLPQSTIEYLVNPSARTIGQALDGVATALCWPLLKLRIIQKAKLEQFTKEIREKNKQIPVENRDSSKVGLAVKAIEEARYQLNEDDIRKLYVNLIASTVDNRKNNVVSPRLATVVAQFGQKEAEFLKIIYQQRLHQMPFGYLVIKNDKNATTRKITNCLYSTDDGSYLFGKDETIDIFNSLGIIESRQDGWLSSPIYESRYQTLENILKQRVNTSLGENESFELNKCYLKLNSFGSSLCHCIFE